MVEDTLNEEVVECSFTAYEIDLDYEFDAARFFDFCRPESPLEAIHAEVWFDSAGSYPPSQLTFYNHMKKDRESKAQCKLKPSIQRISTLMNPTASQLAKQNHVSQTGYSSRSIFCMTERKDKSSHSACKIESQPAKRQKLEGGLLHKVVDAGQPQQTSFFHKVPKRDILLNGTTTHTKTRITMPIEPDLVTAKRALRARPKTSEEAENVMSTVHKFKAGSLNRKILEARSLPPKKNIPCKTDCQEFHLKTSERAMQHTSVVPKSKDQRQKSDNASYKCNSIVTDHGNRELERNVNVSKPEVCESSHGFKALPLNKKILTSKGTIGVFLNSKKETTVPVEFNLHTEKRFNHNPPIDLFNKLSLAPERQTNHESKQPRVNCLSSKGSKENRWGCLQQGNEINKPSKFKATSGWWEAGK